MQHSVGTHWHIVVRSANNSAIKIILVHLETHSHLVFIYKLVGALLILGTELLVYSESVIILIVVLSKGTASEIRLVHLHWMHSTASSRHHVHHRRSSTVIRCCTSVTHSTNEVLALHHTHRSIHLHLHAIHGHPVVEIEWHSL